MQRTPQKVGFATGLILFLGIGGFIEIDPANPQVTAMAAIAVLMAVWWVTEAVPLAITSLLPLALFPVMGIMKGSKTASFYTDSNIILFIGGFFIALAMERWNLHRRLALNIIRLVGGKPSRLALGFMLATGFISMWMSNTATAMMMTPMGLSLALLHEDLEKRRVAAGEPLDPRSHHFPIVLLLTIAYAASIGGLGTLVGTPVNLVFVSVFQREFPAAPPISFARWAAFAIPFSFLIMIASWLLLVKFIYPLARKGPFSGRDFIRDEIKKMGPITSQEIQVGVVFLITAILWIFRADMNIGEGLTIPGWTRLLKNGEMIDDGTIAIVMGMLLFMLPSGRPEGGCLMDWTTAKKVPWAILLLFGGGFALAEGLTVSGLSGWIGGQFVILKGAPAWATILGVATASTAVTEMASNMATVQMELPIMAALARAIQVNPLLLMIPATISASLGFMMPMGTTPNMIVYGTEKVTMLEMMRAGVFLNIMCILLTTLYMLTIALPILHVSPGVFPEWAAAVTP